MVRLTELTISIRRTSVFKTGNSKTNGKAWTQYLIEDYDVTDGARPTHPLLTFEELPTGQPVRVTLEAFPKSGDKLTSYTVRKVKTRRNGGGDADTVSRSEFNRLQARVTALEELYESIPTGASRP